MSEVTRILSAIEQGDPHAAESLLPLVYEEVVTAACLASRALPAAWLRHGYTNVNLISDVPGAAAVTDPAISDAWGFAYSPEGPMFVVNANSEVTTTYRA